MAIHFIGKDPQSPDNGSPTVWTDEENDSIVLQGWKIDDLTLSEIETAGPIPDHEAVIRVPSRMAKFILEAIRRLSATRGIGLQECDSLSDHRAHHRPARPSSRACGTSGGTQA